MVRKFSFNKRNKIILTCLVLIGLTIGSVLFTIFIILPMVITPSLLYFPLGIGTSWTFNTTDDGGTWTTVRNIGDNGEFLGIDFTVHFNEIHDGVWQNRMWLGVSCNSLVWWGFQDTSSKYVASFGLTYVVEPVAGLQANGGTTLGFLTIGGQISIANFQGSYIIEAIEDVTVPAGTFQNCLKMHEIENKAEDKCVSVMEQAKILANMESRSTTLKEKRIVIGEAYKAAIDELNALDDKAYTALLVSMFKSVAKSMPEGELIVPAAKKHQTESAMRDAGVVLKACKACSDRSSSPTRSSCSATAEPSTPSASCRRCSCSAPCPACAVSC